MEVTPAPTGHPLAGGGMSPPYPVCFIYKCQFLSFFGNQPFFTRCSCSNNSCMDQKQEKAVTPVIVDHTSESMKSESAAKPIPASRNAHQHFFPI